MLGAIDRFVWRRHVYFCNELSSTLTTWRTRLSLWQQGQCFQMIPERKLGLNRKKRSPREGRVVTQVAPQIAVDAPQISNSNILRQQQIRFRVRLIFLVSF